MTTRVHNPNLAVHLPECMLHAQDMRATCLGIRKRLGGYCGKVVSMIEPGYVPHCRAHNIRQESSWCRAILSCGFECGRICEWKPQGFQLCPGHQDQPMPCYFLTQIPVETRCRIYALLLPDQTIPACWKGFSLTSDQGPVHTAILRLNKQVYDEAIHIMYSIRTFTILVKNNMVILCNSASGRVSAGLSHSASGNNNSALQDYQMQLMLLEQQNRGRLLIARNQQLTRSTADVEPFRLLPIDAFSTPSEPLWNQPLKVQNFNQIQSFRIEVAFPPKSAPSVSSQHRSRSPVSRTKLQKIMLFEHCDTLHKLVARLLLRERNLQKLEVVLKFDRGIMTQDEVLSAVLILLRPFQRLRKVCRLAQPRVLALDPENQDVELVNFSKEILSSAEEELQDYLGSWVKDLTSTLPYVEPPIFQAYWRLKHLSQTMRLTSVPEFEQLTELLQTARVAREANDMASFQQVLKQVTEIWDQYVVKQALWTKGIQEEFDELGKVFADGIA